VAVPAPVCLRGHAECQRPRAPTRSRLLGTPSRSAVLPRSTTLSNLKLGLCHSVWPGASRAHPRWQDNVTLPLTCPRGLGAAQAPATRSPTSLDCQWARIDLSTFCSYKAAVSSSTLWHVVCCRERSTMRPRRSARSYLTFVSPRPEGGRSVKEGRCAFVRDSSCQQDLPISESRV
jgi:hypothetical protein